NRSRQRAWSRVSRQRPGRPRPGRSYAGRFVSGGVGRDLQRDDGVRLAHRLAALDLVDVLHAFDDLAPHGVLAVEPGGISEADEELAVAGVRVHGAGHRDGAALVLLRGELRLELLTRAAGAGAPRATSLGHEAVDHAMEDNAVVEAVADEFLDAADMAGCEVGAHLNDDGALGGLHHQRVFRIFVVR